MDLVHNSEGIPSAIFQYDVLIPVTQIMSFVCKQTVRTVACIKNFGKQTGVTEKTVRLLCATCKPFDNGFLTCQIVWHQ